MVYIDRTPSTRPYFLIVWQWQHRFKKALRAIEAVCHEGPESLYIRGGRRQSRTQNLRLHSSLEADYIREVLYYYNAVQDMVRDYVYHTVGFSSLTLYNGSKTEEKTR